MTGYVALINILEGKGSSDTTEANRLSCSLLDVFGPELHKSVKPSELLPHLVSTKCLRYVDDDEHFIRLLVHNQGSILSKISGNPDGLPR